MSAKHVDESEVPRSLAALLSALREEGDVIVERDSVPIAILKAFPEASAAPAAYDMDAGGGRETVVFGRHPWSRRS